MLKEKATGRIVKKVITRRYPHREETYTYERYFLELPGELRNQLPPNFIKKYKITDVKEVQGTNKLEVVFSPRKKAPTSKT